MPAQTEKVYSIKIEASQAQQALDQAVKSFTDLKAKSAAANQEQKETQQLYRENAAALKELTAEQKRLEAAKSKAAPGEAWMQANRAAETNLATLKRLNVTVEESRVDYLAAKEAATQAGAAVGQQAAKIKELAAGVKDYKTQAAAAAKEFAPGTFGALNSEIDGLKERLSNLAPGSREAAQAIQELAGKQSQLRQLANAVNSANPRSQARAFQALTGALMGLTAASTAAMSVFGLSEEKAQKYTTAIQGCVSAMYAAEQVSKLVNAENISLIKGIWAQALAWVGLGTSATEASVAAEEGMVAVDTALVSSGVGAILVGIGVALVALIALWDKFTSSAGGSTGTWTKLKAVLSGLWDGALVGLVNYWKFQLQVLSFDWTGAAETARKGWAEVAGSYKKGYADVIDTARRAELAHIAENVARYLDILKSKGEDTLALEVANAKRLLEAQKAGTKERLDATRDYLVLKYQLEERTAAEERAQTLARLQGLAGIEETQGRDAFKSQMAAKDAQLMQQLELDLKAGRGQTAALTQLQAEKQAMQDAYDKELREKHQAAVLAGLEAEISLRRAKGRESYNQEVAAAQKELEFLKSAAQVNQAAVIAAQAKIADLKAARRVELTERAHAAELAGLDAGIALQQAKGEDAYKATVAREERQLQFLRQAGIVSLAAVRAQLGKILSLRAAHALKEEQEERAAELARLGARMAILRARGEDVIDLELEIKQKELTALLEAATKNEAAIVQKQGEINALTEQQLATAAERKRARMIEDFEADMSLKEAHGKDELAQRIKFQRALVELDKADTSEAGVARLRADVQKLGEMEAEMAGRVPNLGKVLLQKLFGVKEEDVNLVSQRLNEAAASISQSVGYMTNALLDEATRQTQQALGAAQQQLQDATQKLSDAQGRARDTAQQLGSAEGARRDYLLGKLAKEKQEVAALAAAKKKAADEEEKQTKRKHELEKISNQLAAASALASNIAAAAEAVYAGIKAVSKGSELPFPANIAAIIAGVAAVGAAVVSARQLASATKYEAGGVIDGPSHRQGGVPFTVAGRPGFEAEGGEFIVRKSVVAQPGILPLLQQINGINRTRIAPPPQSYFADGGILSKGPGVSGGYASASDVGALAARLDQQTALLARLVGSADATAQHTAQAAEATTATAQHTAAIKDKDPTVRWDFEAEQGRRGVEAKLDQAEGFLKG